MRAIFIAVGSEMLDSGRLDTNSVYAANKLMERGILMDMKVVVGDDLENLTWVIKNACKRAQLVIVTGGLGPTEDDLTREAAANALKRELLFREDIVEEIRLRFKRRGIVMPEINTRQAFVLQGAEVLANPVGTAPGQFIDDENVKVVLLPGPPHEMRAMFDLVFEERVAPLSNYFIYRRIFKFGGITESETDALIAEIYTRLKNPRTTILATPGVIEVHLLGRSRKSADEAKIITDEVAEKIKEKMSDYLITEEDISFEEYIVRELACRHLTLSVAESCTGGGLGSCITNVPGSSEVFLGGVIAYANDIKQKILGIKKETLSKHGAVSRETAKEMADGVRRLTGSDLGVSVTGIAGPGGATNKKPVGLVFMHLSAEGVDKGIHQVFSGERNVVRTRTVNHCLNMIREYLRDTPSLHNGLKKTS